MSWKKEKFKKAYNRASEKDSVYVEHNEEYRDYYDLYEYWDHIHDAMYYDDGQSPTMTDLMNGRLLTLLSKLNVRGSKVILEDLYW